MMRKSASRLFLVISIVEKNLLADFRIEFRPSQKTPEIAKNSHNIGN